MQSNYPHVLLIYYQPTFTKGGTLKIVVDSRKLTTLAEERQEIERAFAFPLDSLVNLLLAVDFCAHKFQLVNGHIS